MKRAFYFTLSFIWLLLSFQQAILIAHFAMNQATIAQAFCVNTKSPEMQCHGDCFLKKQLQKTENKDAAATGSFPRMDVFIESILPLGGAQVGLIQKNPSSPRRNSRYDDPDRDSAVPPPRNNPMT